MVCGLCVHKDSQFCHYGVMLLHNPVIIQDAWPEIGDALLTLICWMGEQTCRLPFHIHRRLLTPLWIDVTMQPFDGCQDQSCIIDDLLMVTLATYKNSFSVPSFGLKFLLSLLTANIQSLGWIKCIQYHRGLSVSKPPVFTSSFWQMTSHGRILGLSAGLLWHIDWLTNLTHIEPDFLIFLFAASFPQFPWRTLSHFQNLHHEQQVAAGSCAVSCMN